MDPINQQFNDEFDILYNSIASNAAPGLDEYEKSVFFTQAQEDIVKAYFTPKGNKFQEGYDGTTERQIDFSNLTKLITREPLDRVSARKLDHRSVVYDWSEVDRLLYIINEKVVVTRNGKKIELLVKPISYDEYSRMSTKPFFRPLKREAWRLITDTPEKIEIIGGTEDTLGTYTLRCVQRPTPIILSNLTAPLKIQGLSEESPCALDPILYPDIIRRAVELAKAAYSGDLSTQLALGSTSQTNLGIVSSNT